MSAEDARRSGETLLRRPRVARFVERLVVGRIARQPFDALADDQHRHLRVATQLLQLVVARLVDYAHFLERHGALAEYLACLVARRLAIGMAVEGDRRFLRSLGELRI